ncbi:MAG: TlpA disulfide reductase family protein [candidate division WOR-3 bacterium]
MKKLSKDSCYLRKRAIFYYLSFFLEERFSNFSKIMREEIKSFEEALMYPLIFSIYHEENKIDSAYFYIKKIVEGKDFTEVEPWHLGSYARILYKENEIEKSKLAYGYLIFYYDIPNYKDTLKEILGENYEKEIEKLEKEIEKKYKKIPEFELTLLDGRLFKYKENKDKIMVLNFWCTGCGPCVKEIPQLNELVKRFKDKKNVIFIAVTRESKKVIENFVKKQNFDYLLAVEDKDLHRKLNISAFPTHIIVDKKGRIVWKILGALSDIDKKIEEKIYKLLQY